VGQNPVGDSNIEKFCDRTSAYSQKEWAFLFLNDLRVANDESRFLELNGQGERDFCEIK
jgi:hypothetical protein